MRRVVLISLVIVGVAAVAIGLAAASRGNVGPPLGRSTSAAGVSGASRLNDLDPSGEVLTTGLFRAIAKRENPMVVAITTEARIKPSDIQQFFGGDDDFFSRFFGTTPAPREQLRRGLGSGFLINTSGEILTNNHVVSGAEQIRVSLFGNEHKTYVANVVGRDPLTDSALIKLTNPPQDLQAVALGDSAALQPGDWVMAIGNPFELGHTVTVGVISYNGRPFATTEGRFQNMLQTDASINPGNSGGPLIDVHGQVVGINSAIVSESGGNVGIGFAVPINTVKTLLPQLRTGQVKRGRLGVQVLSTPLTNDEARQLSLPKAQGAVVSRVDPGSPAERAGLQAGDVIVEFNRKPIQDADQLTSVVADTPAGTQAPIVFYRGGKQQTATATVEELQLDNSGRTAAAGEKGAAPGFGLWLSDVTPDVAQQAHLPAGTRGALVQNVEPFTPAAGAGIRRGDVILEVNRKPVQSADDATTTLRAMRSGEPAFVLLSRNGTRQFVELRKE
jgi:serine protease Do